MRTEIQYVHAIASDAVVGIMQPYFFPYLGYFECMKKTKMWIVFDTVQYTPKSWMNRNRILHPTSGWQYITLPVSKFKRFSIIQDIVVNDVKAAQTRIVAQLQHYKKQAPYFTSVLNLVSASFDNRDSDLLADVNTSALKNVCAYLDIQTHIVKYSKLDLDLPEIHHAGQWALEICAALGASAYVNPPGGRELFRPVEFRDRKIQLGFSRLPTLDYDCPGYAQIEYLSIIDVMMWNSPAKIRHYLESTKGDIDYM